jgi:hypothetical protein
MNSQLNIPSLPETHTGALLIVDDFLPRDLALAMRADIDAHFAKPYADSPETHQIWNYWFVPQVYTLLSTQPEKVIQRDSVDRFMGRLRSWSAETLGLAKISWPFLSLYVHGCKQGLHNDAKNGRFGFVYSLTRDERRSTGGETLVFRRGDPFLRTLRTPSAHTNFYELVEPRFNRLVVFDDRVPHGVQLVEGSMDPVEGRLVIHGHIQESAPLTVGPLSLEQVLQGLRAPLESFYKEHGAQATPYHGPLVLRFDVTPAGQITRLHTVLDRVFSEREGNQGWAALTHQLLQLLEAAHFPAASGTTTVTLPLKFAGR